MSGGTGRTGLTLVGQIVGSYFGPIGAAVGGMIGSAVGGAIWPEQLEGPKLEGLQITSSAYGGPLQNVYGGMRVAGNIFWASEIREVARTEAQGKGGGPEVTTYRYYVDLAVGLCEGEIIGIRRIWADQKLIYDSGSDDIATIFASFNKGGERMRFYPGSETQLPDPTIEAALGVGSTPAFRGLAYVTFTDFDLSDYGNRTPNFNIEVIKGGTVDGPRQLQGGAWAVPTGTVNSVRLTNSGAELIASSEGVGRISSIAKLDGTDLTPVATTAVPVWPPNATYVAFDMVGSLLIWPDTNSNPIYTVALPTVNTAIGRAVMDISSGYIDLAEDFYPGTSYPELSDGGNFLVGIVPCVDNQHVFGSYAVADAGTAATYWVLWRLSPTGAFEEVRRGTIDDATVPVVSTGGAMSPPASSFAYAAGMLEADLTHLWIASLPGQEKVRLYTLKSDGELELTHAFDPTPVVGEFAQVAIYANGGVCWVATTGTLKKLFIFTRSPAPDIDVTLDEVVADICERAGLESGDIDVTDLEDIPVRGYLVSPRMSARSAIEPLMTAYAFDAVESDLKIKFVLRQATPAVSIPADDLGAADGSEGAPILIDSDRAQESELPLSIDVTYMAGDADYQLGTQSFKRQAVTSLDVQSIRLAMALTDAEAAEIAARMVYELWIARNTRKWATTIKYSKYEPTDVVELEGELGASYVARIIDKRERGSLTLWEGVDVDAAAFEPTNSAQEIPSPGQTVTLPGLTQGVAADLPPLIETHFGRTGYYAAAAGLSTPWPGAVLFRQGENATAFVAELNFITAATIGGTLDALGAHGIDVAGPERIYAGYYPDHCNTVTVTLTSGSLSSCTDEEFFQFANVALVGQEIIAFRDVEVIDSNTYKLSCLLRGLLGTEWFAKLEPATYPSTLEILPDGTPVSHDVELVQGHRIGDVFLLLDIANVQHFDSQSATARLQGDIKFVTAGRTLGNSGTQQLLTTNASIVQPHPTHLSGYIESGDLILDFAPRTFVGGAWEDGGDAWIDPLHRIYVAEVVGYESGSIIATTLSILDGVPPFRILSTSIPPGADEFIVRVAAVPRSGPASLGNPEVAVRHWSRNITVEP